MPFGAVVICVLCHEVSSPVWRRVKCHEVSSPSRFLREESTHRKTKTTQPTYGTTPKLNLGHIGWRHALLPLYQHCSPKQLLEEKLWDCFTLLLHFYRHFLLVDDAGLQVYSYEVCISVHVLPYENSKWTTVSLINLVYSLLLMVLLYCKKNGLWCLLAWRQRAMASQFSSHLHNLQWILPWSISVTHVFLVYTCHSSNCYESMLVCYAATTRYM